MHQATWYLSLLMMLFWLSHASALAQTKIYSWTDENGVTHYSNVTVPDTQIKTAQTFQFPARPLPQRKSVPLEILHDDPTKKYVRVTLEGKSIRRDVLLLVDTGAQITVIDQELASALEVQPEQYTLMSGINSTVVGWAGRIPRLRLGPAELSDLLIAVSPKPGIRLLGMDVLDRLSISVTPLRLEFAQPW